MSAKDEALVEYIVNNTETGKIRWEPAAGNTFIAPLRGDHTVTIEYHSSGPDILYLRNREGHVILKLDEDDYPQEIGGLFERARRNAYEVDKVIDEIIGAGTAQPPSKKSPSGPITDEDVPF